MDNSLGDSTATIRCLYHCCLPGVILCSSSLLNERSSCWLLVWIFWNFYIAISIDTTTFQFEIDRLGNWNFELWILVFTDSTSIHVDHVYCVYHCVKVVQEEKERGRAA